MKLPDSPTNDDACRGAIPSGVAAARIIVGLLPPLLVLFATSASAADGSSDERFLDGLRQRRLFQLAETYCDSRLQDPSLSSSRRAELTVQRSFTFSDWAVNSAPNKREPLWRRAQQVTEDFVQSDPDNGRLVLVRFQAAMSLLARGELARQEAQLVADNGLLLEEAKTNLREAIRRLEQLDKDIEQELRQRNAAGHRPTPEADSAYLSDYRLNSIRTDAQYQLARGFRNQAQCYPVGSDDRASSLAQALELLTDLAKLNPGHALAWKSRLDEIVCHRLLGDRAAVDGRIRDLMGAEPPADVQLRARAEWIRQLLVTGAIDDAVAVYEAARQGTMSGSAELDFAYLETCLAAWRAASQSKDDAAAARWLSEAAQQVGRIEQLHGPYWTRLAEMKLAISVDTSDSGDLEMLARAADSHYRSGRIDDALRAYDRAHARAVETGADDRAFDLALVAAAIEAQQAARDPAWHPRAATRYRRVALSASGHPQAAEAHLAAVNHAAQIVRQGADGALEQYVVLLREHLDFWPRASTADQVRWYLARVLEHQSDWQEAIDLYRSITGSFEKYAQVVERAAACHVALLDRERTAGRPTETLADTAAQWFEGLAFSGPDGRPPERWSPTARKAALAAAGLRLRFTSDGYAQSERDLSPALAAPENADPAWRAAAQALLVFALAGQGRRDEAADTLAQISQGSTDRLLETLQGLERVAATASADVRGELASLQLDTVKLLGPRREQLTAAQQRSLDQITARALAAAGQLREALEYYRRLATAHPNDAAVQREVAQFLSDQRDPRLWEQALARWREVERRSREGTEGWFLARYSIASLHYRKNDKSQAARLIQLTALLHPELGGAERKAQFEALLAKCLPR